MEKLKIVIILLGLIWFSGCGYIKQTNIESKDIAFSEEETTSIQSDYENYIGTWSEEGKSHESIIYEGGTEFSVEITSDNELNGYLYSQQEISGRFAEIDIICRIEDGECYYPFSDDGWGNSGILYIQFETNVIKISVQDFVMGESNTSGFGIDRTYILSKEEANQNSTEYDGELMDKSTGKPFMVKGKEVTSTVKFTPDKANGTVEVEFTFDASNIKKSTDLVVFESLYRDKVEIAVHADLKDKGQTVTIVPPAPKTPKTSDNRNLGTWIGLGGVGLGAGVAALLLKLKMKKDEDE